MQVGQYSGWIWIYRLEGLSQIWVVLISLPKESLLILYKLRFIYLGLDKLPFNKCKYGNYASDQICYLWKCINCEAIYQIKDIIYKFVKLKHSVYKKNI